VAVKAWEALGKITGRDHTHLAKPKEDEKIRFRDVQAQPRKISLYLSHFSSRGRGRIWLKWAS
jgi:nitrate reductase alpha subunit